MNRMTAEQFRALAGVAKRPPMLAANGRPVRGAATTSKQRAKVGRDPIATREVDLMLPGLPEATNHAYKIVRLAGKGGKQFHKLALSKKAAAYKKLATAMWSGKLINRDAEAYSVRIIWFIPDFKNGKPRRIDIDGMVKQAVDAAFSGLGIDDSKVAHLQVTKVGIAPGSPASHSVSVIAITPDRNQKLELPQAASADGR